MPAPLPRSLRRAGVVSAMLLVGCFASTAHIASLQIGTSPDMTKLATAFGPQDTIFAKAVVANVPGKVAMRWQLIAEHVKGQTPNYAIDALAKTDEVGSDGPDAYSVTAPTNGWPPGTYRLVLTMLQNGTQLDRKSVEFAVPGNP